MTKIFDVVPGWIYAAAIVLLLTIGGLTLSGKNGEIAKLKLKASGLETTLATERDRAKGDLLAANGLSRESEREMARAAAKAKEQTNAENTRLRRDRDAALVQLRDRPSRSAATPSGGAVPGAPGLAGPARWCTGGALHAEDAGVLVWEAARADAIRADREEVRGAYARAQAAIDAFNRAASADKSVSHDASSK